jgi:hypothetical protein
MVAYLYNHVWHSDNQKHATIYYYQENQYSFLLLMLRKKIDNRSRENN